MTSPHHSVEQTPLMEAGCDESSTFLTERGRDEDVSIRMEPLVLRRHLHTQATIDEIYTDQSETRSSCDVIRNTCHFSTERPLLQRALNFLPFVRVLKKYKWRTWLMTDVISGLSVGLLHTPQGLGAGYLSSLGPVYGLYTTFCPILVYMLFGTSPHISMGSNALIALLTANLVIREADSFRSALGTNATWSSEEELQYKVGIAAASCFLGGVILLAMGLLRLGFITNFLSKSFIGGFTFSAAFHLTFRMVVEILNIKKQNHSGVGKVVLTFADILTNLTDTNVADVLMGVSTLVLLLAVKTVIHRRCQQKLKAPIPVDLIVIIIATLISHFAELHNLGVGIVGDVPAGLPSPTLPDMGSLPRVAVDAFITAILIFALTISLGKLTAKLHDITIDDNQEMVAYGLCLLVGGFFQNFPSCTAPPRTMMLSSMGSKSTFNGVTSALFILLVLLVVGQLFVSLPIAALAAVVIVAMKGLLLQIRSLKTLWHVNKADFFIWVVTAAVSVFGDLALGLLVGVVFSMVTVMAIGQLARGRLLGKAASEDLVLSLSRKGVCPVPGVKIFRFDSALYFATQERFRSQLYSLVLDPSSLAACISLRDSATATSTAAADKHLPPDSTAPAHPPSLPDPPGGPEHQHHHHHHPASPVPHGRGEEVVKDKEDVKEKEGVKEKVEVKDNEEVKEKDEVSVEELNRKEEVNGMEKVNDKGEVTWKEEVNRKERVKDKEGVKVMEEAGPPTPHHVIVDCSAMTYIDVAGVDMLTLVVTQFSRVGVDVMLTDVPGPTLGTLQRAGFLEKVGKDKVFFSVMDALQRVQRS
ncbi:prestin-like [Babylonia areolata]|uniref:prestin-like n=1 Tax=Babylonia areolata TaxID=304850 RepID=UPI003FD5132B